ncbi:unnamed protein product [Sphagnum balticum]
MYSSSSSKKMHRRHRTTTAAAVSANYDAVTATLPIIRTTSIAADTPLSSSAAPIAHSLFKCADRDPGMYPAADGACKNFFYVCEPEADYALEFDCASPDTFFDETSGFCLEKAHVSACGGIATTTVQPLFVSSEIRESSFRRVRAHSRIYSLQHLRSIARKWRTATMHRRKSAQSCLCPAQAARRFTVTARLKLISTSSRAIVSKSNGCRCAVVSRRRACQQRPSLSTQVSVRVGARSLIYMSRLRLCRQSRWLLRFGLVFVAVLRLLWRPCAHHELCRSRES